MSTSLRLRVCLASALFLVLFGCASPLHVPDLNALYLAAAQEDGEWRNPVVVIPGILGSKLVDGDSGRVVWGAFTGDYADPEQADGARLVGLPMAMGRELKELRDAVRSDGALEKIEASFLGIPLSQQAYAYILGALGVGGFRDEQLGEAGSIDYGDQHYTCFQFDYDWRRDLVENARLFHRFLEERRAYVVEERRRRNMAGDEEVHFDVVAHSMGGLLLRYYLRYGDQDLPQDGGLPELTWQGAQHIDRAVLIATPNAGSLDAVENLVDGASFAIILPHYAPAILGTMPALYQLLPRGRHRAVVDGESGAALRDYLAPEFWQERGWGLADPDQAAVLAQLLPHVEDADQRRAIALDHQRKCLERATRFHAALDQPASAPEGLELYLAAGDAEPTKEVYAVDSRDGSLRLKAEGPGDGTVLRSSALMDERIGGRRAPRLRSPIDWHSVLFLFDDHLGLTKNPEFTDNILYLLLEHPRKNDPVRRR